MKTVLIYSRAKSPIQTITIPDTVIFHTVAFFWLLFNASVLFPVPLEVKTVITAPFLLFVPGSLMVAFLRLRLMDFWGTLVVRMGLSLTFLMFCGLFANWIFRLLETPEPLSTVPMLSMFNIFFVALFNAVRLQRSIHSVTIGIPAITLATISLFFIPLIFPILAVAGAVSINNTGTNMVILVMLGSIAAFVMALTLFRNRITPHIYPYALFFISLSVLSMTSLRGWYTTGHDIQQEYHVFQLTKQHYFWNIDLFRDAYNACLSITILPTIFADFLQIPDTYIFKTIFQILFALSPVIVFLFLRKYTSDILAFFSAFYFLSFPTFFNDMPMLNRQEIGFIFFFLLLYVLFNDAISKKQKKIVSTLFACGMVVSHYSTTYIVIGLLTLVSLVQFIFSNKWVQKRGRAFLSANVPARLGTINNTQHISRTVLVVLVVFTFYWNSQLTKTSNGLVETVKQTIVTMHTAFQKDNKSSDISYSIFSPRVISDGEYIDNYIKKFQKTIKERGLIDVYPESVYSDYKSEIIAYDPLPLTQIGTILKYFNIDVFHIQYVLRQTAAKVIQLFIGVGFIGLFFYKTHKKYDTEYVVACLVSIVFIVLMIVLPQLSLQYGLLRLFQQSLVFLGLPLVIGSLLFLRFIRSHIALNVAGVLSILFFLTITGFFSTLTGGYYPQLNFNNAGVYYDAYYLHKSEIFSVRWLSYVMGRGFVLHADSLASTKLFSLGDVDIVQSIFPGVVQQSAYVYVSETNMKGHMIVSVDRSLAVRFPLSFLDTNKSLLYNNGSSRIYK